MAQSSSLGDSNPIPLSLLIGGGAGLVGLGIGAGFALGTKQAKREAEVDAELGEFYL